MTTTEHEGYERFLEEFGERLDDAARRRVAERHSRRGVATGALLLAGVGGAAVLLTGGGGGASLDVVAQARAALLPPGEIVHLVTTSHFEIEGGSVPDVGTPWVTESWSASGPLRWRSDTTIPTAPYTTPDGSVVSDPDHLISGPIQLSYASGTAEAYFQQANTLEVTTGLTDDSAPATRFASGLLGLDPVSEVRSMLAAGQLQDAGAGTVNGEAVLRLTGQESGGSGAPSSVEYDVDPSTYAPVQVTVQLPAAPGTTGTPTEVVDVDTYEQLPLNDSNAALLSVQPVGMPTVQRIDAGSTDLTAQAARSHRRGQRRR